MKSPRILLLGKNGQLGWELMRSLSMLGNLICHDRTDCNLSDLKQLKAVIEEIAPDIIVNAAAYTAVDQAETDAALAYRINYEAVDILANFAKIRHILLIHYSTDYVFDGEKASAYQEKDATCPLSVYGKSKLKGELAIRESGCKHFIFRTSWVFATKGKNFAKTILQKAQEQTLLHIVDDQFGAPTSAELIADITMLCLHRWLSEPENRSNLEGLYHLTAGGETSWYGYARYVLNHASSLGKGMYLPEKIKPISTKAYSLPATRPLNSRLDTSLLASTFKLIIPTWQYHICRLVAEFN